MNPPEILVRKTTAWNAIIKNIETDLVAMQSRHFQHHSQYLTISRMLFDNPDFSYTNIDEVFTLDYNIDSLDKILGKVLYNKCIYGKQPKAIYVCIPSLAQKYDGTQVQGFILFSNFELTSKRMFYAYDGLAISPMPNIIAGMEMPALLREFQYLLPYYITRN